MPGFGRLDFRLEKRWTYVGGKYLAATFEWFNALLAKETSEARWDPRAGLVLRTRSALTLPSIGIEGGY
jgi:hypothetical protein